MMTKRTASGMVGLLALAFSVGCAQTIDEPNGGSRKATKIEAVSSTSITGIAGSAVSDRPTVIVRDQYGAGLPGIIVTFTGTGEESLNRGVIVTDASGKATMSGWILSTTAGPNYVNASAGPLLKVDFLATGVAGPPVTFVKISGDDQLAPPGASVMIPPAVRLTDANDNKIAGASVSFAVTNGGGSLSEAKVNTGLDGVARLALWTMGPEGEQSVTASVEGLAPVVFTAISSGDPCKFAPELVPGTTSVKALSSLDCALSDGRFFDSFSIRADGIHSFRLDETSSAFNTALALVAQSGDTVAESVGIGSPNDAQFKVFLTPGIYVLTATSSRGGELGPYTLSSQIVPEAVTDCQEMFVTRGVTTHQSLARGDCGDVYSEELHDDYRIHLAAGTRIVVSMLSRDVDSRIEISDIAGGNFEAVEENVPGTLNARLEYTAPRTGYYRIKATTGYSWGNYTLAIE